MDTQNVTFSQPARQESVKEEGPGRAKKKGNSPLFFPSRSHFNAATDTLLVSHTFHLLFRLKKGGNLSLSLAEVIGVELLLIISNTLSHREVMRIGKFISQWMPH